MTTEIKPETPMSPLPEAAREIARRAAEATKEAGKGASSVTRDFIHEVEGVAGDVSDATKGVAKRVTDSAKDMYQSAAQKAGDAVVTSRDFVGRNPVPVVLGALAFGAAIGALVFLSRRKPTFREQYVEDPLLAVREAIMSALAPVTQRVHDGYDSARDGAGRAMDQLHRLSPGRNGCSFADKLERVGNNLKFW